MAETNTTGESTKDRLVHLEAIMGTLQPNLESLAKNTEINSIEMANVRQICAVFVSKFSNKLNKVLEDVAALVEVLKSDNGDLEKEVGLLKQAVGNARHVERGLLKVKVLEPKTYNKTQNAKELENFLWHIEQYFQVACVLEEERVTITSICLESDAKCDGGVRFKKMLKHNDQ